jgi:hypothetical protein
LRATDHEADPGCVRTRLTLIPYAAPLATLPLLCALIAPAAAQA